MYPEEKIIDGVLCHRSGPDEEWVRFSIEAITTAFVAMRRKAEDLQLDLTKLNTRIDSAKSALADDRDY